MCGRYAITLPPEAVRGYFAFAEHPNFPPRYNIAPTQPIPVVRADPWSAGGARHFILMRWGFLPGFVKDPKDFPLIVNARAETLAEKPSFRAALKRRRCLVIADGFYEWRKDAAPGGRGRAGRRPYLVRRTSGEPMGFAGLYETWCDPTGGEIDTACIVTTAANRLVGQLHDRMPAILEPESLRRLARRRRGRRGQGARAAQACAGRGARTRRDRPGGQSRRQRRREPAEAGRGPHPRGREPRRCSELARRPVTRHDCGLTDVDEEPDGRARKAAARKTAARSGGRSPAPTA